MKSLIYKILIVFLIIIVSIMLYNVTYAASMNMSISKTSGYVGDTFSVTISGINGRVNISANSNVSISSSGSQWVEGSLTITGTAKSVGTGTITVTPEDAVTTSAEPEEVTSSASRSITIMQKEVEQPLPQTTTTTKSNISTEKSKKTTTESKPVETEVKEETPKKSENFFISTLVLNGINNKGEYIEIKLTPEFNKEIYEYECNIGNDIDKIEIQKDAGEYTDSIVITGLEEIKEGENIVKVELIEEGYETKTYTIKIIKDKQEIAEEQDNLETNQDKKKLTVSMPLWVFIVMEFSIVILEAILIRFLNNRRSRSIRRKH